MADIEFFFDPVCPWAWITSRWVNEVASLRTFEINWRFISLRLLNIERDYDTEFPPGYVEGHTLGLRLLRVAAAARDEVGNNGVARLYSALGTAIHVEQRQHELVEPSAVAALLGDAGLPERFADAFDDETHDKVVAAETELALERAGRDVGTPVLTFAPPDGPSFFGPVINRVPRGDEALALWDATERLACFTGFAELKRSVRGAPQFG
ncbi:MAG: mycothiol-dependent nitroreductase Rv2466c family protein [Acidimicrobiales bacterium]